MFMPGAKGAQGDSINPLIPCVAPVGPSGPNGFPGPVGLPFVDAVFVPPGEHDQKFGCVFGRKVLSFTKCFPSAPWGR